MNTSDQTHVCVNQYILRGYESHGVEIRLHLQTRHHLCTHVCVQLNVKGNALQIELIFNPLTISSVGIYVFEHRFRAKLM